MTKNQLQALYGWSDVEILQQVHRGNLKHLAEADQYELVTKKVEKFTTAVLHEVGHAVDDMLGRRTEPVFGGTAHWHSFSESDFDAWAAEMGGWDKVSADDKRAITEAWLVSLRQSSSVKQLVGPDHPAVAKRYEDVGIVAAARAGKDFDHATPVVVGDRAFIKQPYYGQFYSVSATALATRPSVYSMYAPQEYFAECYVEYYREVDGGPGAAAKKGGALPSSTKDWFDKHVDTLKFDAKRFDPPT
jgi:hypothetical protein